MKKMAVTAAILVTLLLLPAAGAQTSLPRPPDAFLSSDSGEVKGEIQSYCWTEGSQTLCADRFAPIDPASALTVQPGEPLTLRFDRPISPTRIRVSRSNVPAFPFPSEGSFDVPAGNPTQFTLNVPPGTYFLGIRTDWAQGDATYVFEVNVTSTTSTSTSTTSTSTSTSTSTTSTTIPATVCDGRQATIVGTRDNDTIVGTPGDDVIVGLGGSDSIQGLGGNDVICGGSGNDQIDGGEGNDRIFGQDGNDRLVGGPGNNALFGDAGADQCFVTPTSTAATCEQVLPQP